MQLKLTGRHIAITDALRRYVEKKMARLARYGVPLQRVQVVLSVEKYRHVAEVIANLEGIVSQAKASSREMYAAIDVVVEKMSRQIEKRKTKQKARKPPRGKAQPPRPRTPPPACPAGLRLVRPAVEPMLLDEAVQQLDLTGSGLIVFIDAVTGRMQVLHRLDKERLELVDPQVGLPVPRS